MSRPLRVYLAGPEVFLDQAPAIFHAKRAICVAAGFEGLAPLDNELLASSATPRELAMSIYQANVDLMNRCDAIVANITPFRGPHMDPGTAFELGYCAARDKRIVCYTQDGHDLVGRVQAWSGARFGGSEDPRDHNGHRIEDFGLNENLMIASLLDQERAQLVVANVPENERFLCVRGFETAVRQLAFRVGS